MKVKKITTSLVGTTVPSHINGQAGRYIENYIKDEGWPVDTRSSGPDVPQFQLEIKSRNRAAVSHHTVGSMLAKDIVATDYRSTVICQKLQQQFRVTTQDQVVVDATVYDFSDAKIQKIFQDGYEKCREALTKNCQDHYIRGNDFCFMETRPGTSSYKFRIFKNKMTVLEGMAMRSSQFNRLFEECNQ